MNNKKLSLEEATVKAIYDQLPTDNSQLTSVDGIVDDILVITDPEVTSDEYNEVIDRAQELVKDTPEGDIPLDTDYLDDFVQTCPICGATFAEDHMLQPGDACPVCLDTPESFILKGKIAADEDVAEEEGIETPESEETDDTIGSDTTLEDNVEDNDKVDTDTDKEEDKLEASEQVKESDDKLEESLKLEDHQLYYDDIQEMSTEERHKLWMQDHDIDFEDTEDGNNKFWDWAEEEYPVKELNESKGIDNIIDDMIHKDDTFKYQMLSRLQMDCDYFLGNGNRAEKYLWATNVPDHIKLMRALYNSFEDDKKPEWLTEQDIDNYEKEMSKTDKVQESLEQNEEEGWGDDIQEICEPFFQECEKIMYEVRNCRRGSYANVGDTVADLVEYFDGLEQSLEEVSTELDGMEHQLQETSNSEINAAKEDAKSKGLYCEDAENTDKEYTLTDINDNTDKIKELENLSAFTFEGCSLSNKNLEAIVNIFKANTDITLPVNFFTWSGKTMNELYNLHNDNAYPDGLHFVAVDLNNWSSMRNLPGLKIGMKARWLDDIVDNNAYVERNNSEELDESRKVTQASAFNELRKFYSNWKRAIQSIPYNNRTVPAALSDVHSLLWKLENIASRLPQTDKLAKDLYDAASVEVDQTSTSESYLKSLLNSVDTAYTKFIEGHKIDKSTRDYEYVELAKTWKDKLAKLNTEKDIRDLIDNDILKALQKTQKHYSYDNWALADLDTFVQLVFAHYYDLEDKPDLFIKTVKAALNKALDHFIKVYPIAAEDEDVGYDFDNEYNSNPSFDNYDLNDTTINILYDYGDEDEEDDEEDEEDDEFDYDTLNDINKLYQSWKSELPQILDNPNSSEAVSDLDGFIEAICNLIEDSAKTDKSAKDLYTALNEPSSTVNVAKDGPEAYVKAKADLVDKEFTKFMDNNKINESKKITESDKDNLVELVKTYKKKLTTIDNEEDLEDLVNEVAELVKDKSETNWAAEDLYYGAKDVMDDQDAADRGPTTYIRSVKLNFKNILDDFINDYADACADEELDENKKVNVYTETKSLGTLVTKIQNKINKVLQEPEYGFTEKEIKDYTVVETEKLNDEEIKIEVRAELDYEGLDNLMTELNPIIQKYDENSYFDADAPGIASAIINIKINKIVEVEAVGKEKVQVVMSDNETQIANWIKDTVEDLKEDEAGCGTWKLDDRLAICVGWSAGYDKNDTDDNYIHSKEDPTYCINAAIKVWTSDDMRTDLDYINYPYDDENTYDDSYTISKNENYNELAKSLLQVYSKYEGYDIDKDGKITSRPVEENKSIKEELYQNRKVNVDQSELDKIIEEYNKTYIK